MTVFETLLALLALAIALLQVSRRLSIPYPALLASAGVLIAFLPSAPSIALDPHTALALFIAPALAEAAFDFPMAAMRRYWRPLFALVVVAVLLTAATVAWIGVAYAGLPLYAALALGAIVAPPDAAAATAILGSVKMPRRSVIVLKGESLLNDAVALLIFTAAVAFHSPRISAGALSLQLALAVPAGIALGVAAGMGMRLLMRHVTGTLGATLLEFVSSFALWIVAERLHLSAVLCLVAYGMTIARFANMATAARMRIHSFAVWDTAVFLLNVLAFLIMGLQARTIIAQMSPERLNHALVFAGMVVSAVIAVRMAWLIAYNRLAFHFAALRGGLEPVPLRHGILIGWSGMRGLVTLATAFALPQSFPQRDLVVISAFAVVLGTLVLQGLTLTPLVRFLKLGGDNGLSGELRRARRQISEAAHAERQSDGDSTSTPCVEDDAIRLFAVLTPRDGTADLRHSARSYIGSQRARLEQLFLAGDVGSDAFLILQEELDFAEVAVSDAEEREIKGI